MPLINLVNSAVSSALERSLDVLRAEGEIARLHVARTLFLAAATIALIVAAGAGVATLLVALTWALAEPLGVAGALAVTGGLVLVFVAIGAAGLRVWWRRGEPRTDSAPPERTNSATAALDAPINGRMSGRDRGTRSSSRPGVGAP